MSIWKYDDIASDTASMARLSKCPFCSTGLIQLHGTGVSYSKLVSSTEYWVCQTCGWWRAYSSSLGLGGSTISAAAASLRELDLTDLSTPLQEVRSFLLAKYEARYSLHPRLFEETVAAVFRDKGYYSRATAYRADDGIDVILEGPDDIVGIQVKRVKNSVEIEQIRSLAGALVYGRMTRGMFVTTSRFQAGAPAVADEFASTDRGIPIKIELVDAEAFYAELQLTQRSQYLSRDDLDLQWIRRNMVVLSQEPITSAEELDEEDEDWFHVPAD